MTFDPTKPVLTRDGRRATITKTEIGARITDIEAEIEFGDGTKGIVAYDKDGLYAYGMGNHPLDLINLIHFRSSEAVN